MENDPLKGQAAVGGVRGKYWKAPDWLRIQEAAAALRERSGGHEISTSSIIHHGTMRYCDEILGPRVEANANGPVGSPEDGASD